MPMFRLELESDDTEGHGYRIKLDQEAVPVTLVDPDGAGVQGHLSRKGETLIFEASDEATGHGLKFPRVEEEAEVTIVLGEGEEVKAQLKK